MGKLKIGLLKETKTPPDNRAALSPNCAKMLVEKYPDKVEVCIQSSQIRAFSDDEYKQLGLKVVNSVEDCDLLLGVKEVKIETLIPEKTYMFFAHVTKMQEHNKKLLKALIEKKITLIDYEFLTDDTGKRLIAFGYWAGLVGAYNGLRAWFKRFEKQDITPAHKFKSKAELIEYIKTLKITKPFKIVVTGTGRVATGAIDILKAFGIKEVIPEDFLTTEYCEPVYTQLDSCHYVRHKDGKPYRREDYHNHPEQFISTFRAYTKTADMYIAAHYWDPRGPKFFTLDDVKQKDFRIKVIADVSCDLNGPIPTTIRPTTIEAPFYDFDPYTESEKPPFSADHHITVMAVDNLPSELPRDATEDFCQILVNQIIPLLIENKKSPIIERATILKNGQLTDRFKYLENWVNS